ncbi:hypothetical protein [Streptomyces sp. NPDC049916]|uniref:hypothetical protein n=1 Tax=Streptomyces sp. NPDC049916 TaxID=3155156 RepID=UPI0034231035
MRKSLLLDEIVEVSGTRRGRPAVTRRTGPEAATLIGGLTHVLADGLPHEAGLAPDRLASILRVTNRPRADAVHGQYLGLPQNGQPVDRVVLVVEPRGGTASAGWGHLEVPARKRRPR